MEATNVKHDSRYFQILVSISIYTTPASVSVEVFRQVWHTCVVYFWAVNVMLSRWIVCSELWLLCHHSGGSAITYRFVAVGQEMVLWNSMNFTTWWKQLWMVQHGGKNWKKLTHHQTLGRLLRFVYSGF